MGIKVNTLETAETLFALGFVFYVVPVFIFFFSEHSSLSTAVSQSRNPTPTPREPQQTRFNAFLLDSEEAEMESTVAATGDPQDKIHGDVMLFNRWSYEGVEVSISLSHA